MRNMTRLRGFIEAVEQYGIVIEVFLNASNFITFIWGPVKFLLMVARTWTDALDTLLDAYEQLGETIPLLCQYENLFSDNRHMRRVLGYMYADILEFHRRALVIFKRKAWKQLFHTTWKTFNTHFGRLLESLKDNAALIDRQATVIEIENNQLSRKAQETRIFEAEREELKRQSLTVVSKLSPADFQLDQDNASNNWVKGQSFGLWLLENTKMTAWLNPTDTETTLLWLKGIPGAGKTILTSRLIAVMQEMDRNVVFFYCKDEDKLRNSFTAILKAFLSQLVAINTNVLSYIYEECVKSREVMIESLATLKTLLSIALDYGEPIWLILDGLDECEPKERKKFLSWILPLLKAEDKPEGNLRLLIVSRDEGDIRKRLYKVPWITLHELAAHSNEIRVYTSRKLMKIQRKFDLKKEETKALCDRMNSKAKGMFLFARLMLKHLKGQTSLAELRAEVNPSQFPEGLDQVYERIVRRIYNSPTPSERNAAKTILEWIVCARRALRWNELQAIFSIDLDAETVDFDSRCLRPNDPELCHSTVKKLCGSLVEISNDNTIHLVHETAKTYLIGQNNGTLARIQINKTEFDVTKTCLKYLSFPAFVGDLTDEKVTYYLSNGHYAFQDYAIAYWLDHLEAFIRSTPMHDQLFLIAAALDKLLSMHIGKDPDFYLRAGSFSVENMCNHILEYLRPLKPTFSSGAKNQQSKAETSCSHVLQNDLCRRRLLFECTMPSIQNNAVMKDSYTLFYGPSTGWYKCSTLTCFGFWEGFPNFSTRQTHTQKHDRAFRCLSTGCPYGSLGFATYGELKRHKRRNHNIPQEDVTFPAPGALTRSVSQMAESMQDTSDDQRLQGQLVDDTSKINVFEQIGNKLGGLDLETVPTSFKTVGHDWYAINKPSEQEPLAIEPLHTFTEESVVCAVNFSLDATLVALGCNHFVEVFAVASGTKICRCPSEPQEIEDNYFRSVAFSPINSRLLVVGCEDKLLKFWDLDSKQLIRNLAGHEGDIYGIDFTVNGLKLASCSQDQTVRIWNSETGSCEGVLKGDDTLACVSFSPDARLIAVGSVDNSILLYDVKTLSLVHKFDEVSGHEDGIYSLTFSPTDQHLYSGSLNRLVKKWRYGGPLKAPFACVNTIDGPLDYILTTAVTTDDRLLFCGSKDRGVYIYDAKTGTIRCFLYGHKHTVISVKVSTTSTEKEGIFVTCSGDMTARIWKYQAVESTS